jgi:hypothetical protein
VRPVALRFTGRDATSGVARCTAPTYAGPDGVAAPVRGACTDVAGNVSPPATFPLSYDGTVPAIRLRAIPADGRAVVRWRTSPDTHLVVLRRADARRPAKERVVLRSDTGAARRGYADRSVRNDRRYLYRLSVFDRAGNVAVARATVRPGRRLLSPAPAARLRAPPRLSWTAIDGARYYNVQLFRAGRKILSAWPRAPHLQLESRWVHAGLRERLIPGLYRWYVWPGVGPRAHNRYGPRVGTRLFRVR